MAASPRTKFCIRQTGCLASGDGWGLIACVAWASILARGEFRFHQHGQGYLPLPPELPFGSVITSTPNDENRQVKVELPAGTTTTNTFRAGGLRTQKDDSSGTTKFIYDGENYLAETDEIDVTQSVSTNEPQQFGKLISQRRQES